MMIAAFFLPEGDGTGVGFMGPLGGAMCLAYGLVGGQRLAQMIGVGKNNPMFPVADDPDAPADRQP